MIFPRLGVGLQFNPELLDWFPFFDQPLDALEILFDSFMAPVDGPGIMMSRMIDIMHEAALCFPLLGHSNYGGDFGFHDLSSTSAVNQHVPLAKKFNVPWVSNHCFYCDESWSNVWSSPVQFSRAEIVRIGKRARLLQNLYGVPLAHENAAYYRTCPGSEMPEEDFLAQLIELSDTYLHLDLHNLYANALNHGASGYSITRFLDTIPLNRVICIHMAGGRWYDNQYHDLHDTQVPEAVWDLLDEVLSRTSPGAVIFEYETESLRTDEETFDTARSIELILADLEQGRAAWDRAYGSRSRRLTRQDAA
jgi:uncharacterized protein